MQNVIHGNIWKVSLERVDPELGYIKDNVVLCCLEFNSRVQWSLEKIERMKTILRSNLIVPEVSFALKDQGRRKPTKCEKTIRDNVIHYNCTRCGNIKPYIDFHKRPNEGCKECQKQKHVDYASTPRGKLMERLSGAKKRTQARVSRSDIKRNNSFDIDFDFLVELYYQQKGLCAYSGIPLTFGLYLEQDWVISIERKNPLKGYTKENVCLICFEFNSSDRTAITNDVESGSSGWNSDKFLMFYNNITS